MYGIKLFVIDGVYRPSDDSYILLEEALHSHSKGACLEIGCGSGIISIAIAKRGRIVVCVDISPCAVRNARINAVINGVDALVDVVQCDSGECLRSAAFKSIMFNPPYIPIPRHECLEASEVAWCGGDKGVEIALKFLENALRVCSRVCEILFVVSTLQSYGELIRVLSSRCGNILLKWSKSFFFEKIGVVRGSGCLNLDGRHEG